MNITETASNHPNPLRPARKHTATSVCDNAVARLMHKHVIDKVGDQPCSPQVSCGLLSWLAHLSETENPPRMKPRLANRARGGSRRRRCANTIAQTQNVGPQSATAGRAKQDGGASLVAPADYHTQHPQRQRPQKNQSARMPRMWPRMKFRLPGCRPLAMVAGRPPAAIHQLNPAPRAAVSEGGRAVIKVRPQ